MAYEPYEAKAPGSFMLFGEHAVLRGKFAVVCAANQWISIKLTPQDDHYIQIISPTLGEYKTDINNLIVQPPFQFVLGALSLYKHQLHNGCIIEIESEFSPQLGLGSSAAVTAATIAVLNQWLGHDLPKQELFLKARQVIRRIQGLGSGADLAASIYGGVIAYRNDPIHIEKLPMISPVQLIYSGYKTPTVDVVNKINQQQHSEPKFYDHLFECIGHCTEQAIEAIKHNEWEKLGSLMETNQALQKALGTSDKVIDEIISQLEQDNKILGAKISGSGLGDCVVALGDLDKNSFPKNEKQQRQNIQQIPVEISNEGLCFVD